jgi:hypothetical protein
VHKLDQDSLLAIGRMTVAAAGLEHTLAWIAADRDGEDPAAVFARPGDALRDARRWAESAPPSVRSQYLGLVEGAATQLARGQAALRSLWRDDVPAIPAKFDEISTFLNRVNDALTDLARDRLAS